MLSRIDRYALMCNIFSWLPLFIMCAQFAHELWCTLDTFMYTEYFDAYTQYFDAYWILGCILVTLIDVEFLDILIDAGYFHSCIQHGYFDAYWILWLMLDNLMHTLPLWIYFYLSIPLKIKSRNVLVLVSCWRRRGMRRRGSQHLLRRQILERNERARLRRDLTKPDHL